MRDELSDPVSQRRSIAFAKVDNYIADIPGAGRISARMLERYQDRGYCQGWQVPVDFSDGVRRDLYVLANTDFPYAPTRIAIAQGPSVLTWPHLEAQGFICILPDDVAVSSEDPAGVVAYVLGEACRLIEDSVHGRNIADFRREFLSYWELAACIGSQKYISLIEPSGPGRRVNVWRGQHRRIVGESQEAVVRWLSRWGAKKEKGRNYKLYDGVLVWLPEPLVPGEYPHTAADVRALARERSPEAASELEVLAASTMDEIDIILGARTSNGACFAGLTIRPPRPAGGLQRKGDVLIKGFRPGHVPQRLLVNRYLSGGAKVTKSIVERADHLWIHGRDQDPRQGRLRQARIAILGCGSVGGPLARLMAQAGVGNLLLVDPGKMDWANISRHELGAPSVSHFKAPELAREIEKAYPHLGEIKWRNERVGPGAKDLIKELRSCDLIVSTMGNWPAENFLNDVQQETDGFPPILYGWVEPNATAAHALLIPRCDACLSCGTNDKGRPYLTVTDWPNGGDSRQVPACGALFTPYGPTELSWAHALLSETAISALIGEALVAHQRIWVGPRSRVEANGGAWSAAWAAEVGDPGAGGMIVERRWIASASCPVCGRRARTA